MLATSPPRLHLTVNLPPVISFSSVEEPQLEVRMTLEYSQPVIIVLKRSCLWPLQPPQRAHFVQRPRPAAGISATR